MNLSEIKEALSKATPGKWEVNDFDTLYSAEIISEHPKGVFNGISSGMYAPNAHLIANAPEWLASLVSQVEEMQKTLEWYANPDAHEIKRRVLGDFAPIALDKGERARLTLQSLKGESK